MRETTPEEKYIGEEFGINDPDLVKVHEELVKHDLDFMAVSAYEARILQFLIRGFGVKKIVEVGTLFGFSTVAMAKALPADGQIITLEKSPENHAQAQKLFQQSSVSGKITALCGDGDVLLKEIENRGPFDMVFIDANKAGYVNYLKWAEKNVRSGGLIVGDNTFLFGALWGQTRDRNINEKQIDVMHEFNRCLADPKRYNSILIPTTEGMTVAQKL